MGITEYVTIDSNQAMGFNGGGAIFTKGFVDLSESVALRNNSGKSGGAIYGEDADISVIGRVRMEKNTAVESGGAIYAKSGSVVNIIGGTADSVTADDGTFISENKAGSYGGAIYLEKSDLTGSSFIRFVNNEAQQTGGAIVGSSTSFVTLKAEVVGGVRRRMEFEGNTAVLGEHVALYGKIAVDELELDFRTCNTFVFAPEVPCSDTPPYNTIIRRYFSSGGCAYSEVSDRMATDCECHENGRINATGRCYCVPGYFGNGKTYCYDDKIPEWRNMSMLKGLDDTDDDTPSPRTGHAMTKDGNENVWIFGGEELDGNMSDPNLYQIHSKRYVWIKYDNVTKLGGPGPRKRHTMAHLSGDKIVLHGGRSKWPTPYLTCLEICNERVSFATRKL
jgi:predicted outer membrane repeat protein